MIGRFQGCAHRARNGDARTDILAKVDPRDAQRRPARDDLHQSVQHRLGGRAIQGIGRHLPPIDHIFDLVDGAVERRWLAASGAGLLPAWGRYQHLAQVERSPDRCPEAG